MSSSVGRDRKVWLVALGVAVTIVIAGCVTPAPSIEPTRNFRAAASRNGLSDSEREDFYHLSEGGELAPLALFEIMHVLNGRRLSDWLEGYGFIPDPDNKHGLPIGFSVEKSRAHGIEMVGINCAACHVTDIHFEGKRVRVDGAPNQVDIIRLYRDLADHSLSIVKSVDRAFGVFRKAQHRHDTSRAFALEISSVDELKADSEYGRQMAGRLGDILSAEGRSVARGIEASGHDYVHDVLTGTRIEQDSAAIAGHVATLTALPPVAGEDLHAVLGPHHHGGAAEVFEDFSTFSRLLHAQVAYLVRLKEIVDEHVTPTGPGRIDAFGIVRNLLFVPRGETFPIDAPVSIPHLWGLKHVEWLHWNANTNSVMQRNIAQALGTGAFVDMDTWESTVDLENLHALEKLSHRIESPKWPAEVFGPIDAAAAERGRPIYQKRCAGCHDASKTSGPLVDYELYALADGDVGVEKRVDTDPNYARNFDQPVGELPFPLAVRGAAGNVENHYYEKHAVPVAMREKWKGHGRESVEWRSPLSKNNTTAPVNPVHPARPLAGVWATAPYLHNGSIPSLYALLSKREEFFSGDNQIFHVGHREFDPVHVGYAIRAADGNAAHEFDTTLPGNLPQGHLFGLDLAEIEKMNLIEYLKTL